MFKPSVLLRAVLSSLVVCYWLVVASASAQTLKADYQFQDTLASSVGTAPDLSNLGSNIFVTETVDDETSTLLFFPEGSGLALSPTTGLIPSDTYSIVVLFRFDAVTSWRRIVDFKNAGSDNGLYNYFGNLNFYPVALGPEAPITPNAYVQVVLTRDPAGNVVGYVNGVPQFSFVDTSGLAVIDGNNILRFFQDDNVVRNELSAGAVARIRLYDGALTASQVAELDRLPTCPSGEPQITKVSPSKGGNTSTVTITILGKCFKEGAVVRLMEGSQVVLTGQNTVVASHRRIQTTFDLQGQTPRSLRLDVVNPDSASAVAPEAFTIEEGAAAQPWVDIIGRDVIRVGREQTFNADSTGFRGS